MEACPLVWQWQLINVLFQHAPVVRDVRIVCLKGFVIVDGNVVDNFILPLLEPLTILLEVKWFGFTSKGNVCLIDNKIVYGISEDVHPQFQ
jgi:hypothetical protein